MDFEAKRQSILDEGGNRIGYEFFLVYHGKESFPREPVTNKTAFITMRTLAEYGLAKVGEGHRIFIRIPIDSLLVRAYELLYAESMVYRIQPASVGAGKTVYRRALETLEKLRSEGALISIHHRLIGQHPDIVQLADILELSVEGLDPAEVTSLRGFGKKILLFRIDSQQLYERFRRTADYYQGEYLDPAQAIDRFRLAPFLKSTLLRLLVLMNTAQSPVEFARVIETDVGMSAKLLRFLNSAYFSLRKKVSSVEQATVYFGLKNIKNFIIVLSMNDYASVAHPSLWKKSLVRAKLMEELAKNTASQLTGEAYLVGLFSLIDMILEVDIAGFLREVNVEDTIVSAFTDSGSTLGKLLSVAVLLEEKGEELLSLEKPEDEPLLEDISQQTGIGKKILLDMIRNSYLMAETIIHL